MTVGEVCPDEEKSAQIGPATAFGFRNPNPYGQDRVLSFPDPPSSAIIRASSRGHLGNVEYDVSFLSQANINVLAKPIGPICNLSCSYCYYLDKEQFFPSHHSFRMSEDVLEAFIHRQIEEQEGPEIGFCWQGGEPTLIGLDFFEKAVALQQHYKPPGRKVLNMLQTNGTILNDDWCRFLANHNFLVGVSLDGPPNLHDANRQTKKGKPTHGQVVKGLKNLQRHRVEVNSLTVVNSHNVNYPLEVYRHLKRLGIDFMQFIPLVERVDDTGRLDEPPTAIPGVSEAAVFCPTPEAYGAFMCAIFDTWVRQDVGKIFIQMFDGILSQTLGFPASLCVFAETCGANLAMEHNGDLYACDHYVYPKYHLGNICDGPLRDAVMLSKQQDFGRAKRDRLPRQCRECEYLSVCHGGCLKHRFLTTEDGDWGLNYLCQGYRRIFEHTRPAMRRMASLVAQGRRAADIMRRVDQGPVKIGRNDPCPCKSGRKYKKCCGNLSATGRALRVRL